MILGTIASALLGSGGALLSNIITSWTKYIQDRADKAHELALLEQQSKIAAIAAAEREAISKYQAEADMYKAETDKDMTIQKYIAESIRSKDGLIARVNGLIRPVITSAFNVVFFYVLISTISYSYDYGLTPIQLYELPIFLTFLDTFTLITTFWFTNRSMNK